MFYFSRFLPALSVVQMCPFVTQQPVVPPPSFAPPSRPTRWVVQITPFFKHKYWYCLYRLWMSRGVALLFLKKVWCNYARFSLSICITPNPSPHADPAHTAGGMPAANCLWNTANTLVLWTVAEFVLLPRFIFLLPTASTKSGFFFPGGGGG